ncbi:hypothetical protein ABFY27_06580 [Akkermansia massiliensis]
MTWSWNKLSPAKWEDAWSERIAGNPNASITIIKGARPSESPSTATMRKTP